MIICPACGADMHFSPASQLLVCDYCDTTLSPNDYAESEGLLTNDSEYYDTTIFSCPQCGGEIMNTEETAATFCSYCGASVQLMSRMGKEKRPAKIIPFSIDTQQCQENFKKRVRRAIFAPAFLRKDSEIEKFRGIYMPYWSYGFTVDQKLYGEGTTSKRKGDYIITDHYRLEANANGEYDGISFDSASNFDDEISEGISPFATKEAKDFDPAYLSGFYADRGDVAASVYSADAVEYLKTDVANSFKAIPAFRGVTIEGDKIRERVSPDNEKHSSVLYPVWFLTNHFGKDRVAYAVANGQTGKIAADIPIDPKRYLIISLIVALPIFLILNALPAMEPGQMIFYAMILHLIGTVIAIYQDIKIDRRERRANDKGYNSTHAEEEGSRGGSVFKMGKYLYHFLLLFACFILFIISLPSDIIYYGCCAAVMIGIGISYIGIIRQYNLLSTHKMPQLEKRGGDENE